ncbi:MAG: hypothetical protein NTU69_11625 [Proteobacteria bacterium]|nr:hypothetical protein [Pseudomonadota bacterium]
MNNDTGDRVQGIGGMMHDARYTIYEGRCTEHFTSHDEEGTEGVTSKKL